MAQKPPQREYVIRLPKNDGQKRFSILKFNDSLNVDPVNWPVQEVRMAREDNERQVMSGVIEQDYGEGTEYGRAAREEARRKKYGRQRRAYNPDKQPWLLTIKEERDRKFRSIREGSAGEYADYWVFLKAGDDFHAHKITEWYQFLPCVTHKTLDIDQAEERFQQRNKVMNQFALKAQIMQQLNKEPEETLPTKASRLMIKDEASSEEEEEEDEEGVNESKSKKNVKRNPKGKQKKDKRQRVENADEVAAYESEDGQDEGREYDYMSDSGSDTDREEKTIDEKLDEELVGVGDEGALKKTIGSDLESSSDEDEDNNDNAEIEEEEKPREKSRSKREKKKADNDVSGTGKAVEDPDGEEDSSDSDLDDPDSKVKSVLFMQRKDVRKRAAADDKSGEPSSSSQIEQAKRAKVEERPCEMPSAPLAAHGAAEALDEEMVRRLLLRKPHTTKDLLNRVKPKCGQMSKQEIVSKLANILKRIEPYQFRQKVDNKEVLYFSLNRTA